jgi:hypothetical protein
MLHASNMATAEQHHPVSSSVRAATTLSLCKSNASAKAVCWPIGGLHDYMRVLMLQYKGGAMLSMSCNIEQRSVAVVLHCAVSASCCAIWMMLGVVRQSDSSGSNSSSSRRRRSNSQAVAT